MTNESTNSSYKVLGFYKVRRLYVLKKLGTLPEFLGSENIKRNS